LSLAKVITWLSLPVFLPTQRLDSWRGHRGKYGGRGSLTSGKRCGVEVNTWKMVDWLQYNYLEKPPLFGNLILPQIAKKFTAFNGI
jgi:hypothetical protein